MTRQLITYEGHMPVDDAEEDPVEAMPETASTTY
jgi:hypothetical protein